MAAPHFRIDTREDRSGTTFKVGGELDSAASAELAARFEQVAAAGAASGLVLDLSEVSFIDSAGMRAIIAFERGAAERDLALTIVPPPSALTDVLQITGIADHVPLAPRSAQEPDRAPAQFVERIELELSREPTAPARARAELREAFRGRLGDTDCATATLLTSELVTNAVIHPDPNLTGPVGLRMTVYPDRIRVEVTDAGSGFEPGRTPPRRREAGGHGLVVVDGLSSRWGTTRRAAEGGQVFSVWFEIDVESDLSAAREETDQPMAAAES